MYRLYFVKRYDKLTMQTINYLLLTKEDIMGLFDKKYCDICGEKIGMLGNRKLEDGNLCKKCAAKLSPFFSDRRRSTVADIRTQLEYREANKEAVAAFRVTRSFGEGTKILLDEDARKFVVTRARNLVEDNPDVINYSMVTGVDIDIDEDADEAYRTDSNGNSSSYAPPRYTYSYNFYVVIRVNHPYFDTIKVELNNSSVETTPNPVTSVMKPNPEHSPEYMKYKTMCEEIKEALMGARKQARDEAAAASAPPEMAKCPYCGATTTPDRSGCCEYCGSPLK